MREIASSRRADDPGLTVAEWAKELGRSENWVRTEFKQLLHAGKLVRGKQLREDLSGRQSPVPVYRLK